MTTRYTNQLSNPVSELGSYHSEATAREQAERAASTFGEPVTIVFPTGEKVQVGPKTTV